MTLLGLCLLPGGCHKAKKSSVPVPPTPNEFAQAETYFESGDYAQAAPAYEAYLRANPSAANRDRVLFRLAMTYAFPDSPVYNPDRAIKRFEQLLTLAPENPYKRQAEVVLRLRAEAERFQFSIRERENRISRLQSELDQLRSSLENQQSEVSVRDNQIGRWRGEADQFRREVDRLRAELRERDERIKALRDELEQLKKIDLQKRLPRRPQ